MVIKELEFERLALNNLDKAKELCDKFVGKNLYTREYLESIIDQKERYFYLILSDNKAVAYFYCFIGDLEVLKNTDEFNYPQVLSFCEGYKKFGVCKSIGIGKEYRQTGLSKELLDRFSARLFDNGCEVVLIPAWIKGDFTPARDHLERSGFKELCIVEKPWSKHKTLECDYCKAKPCICNGAIYFKKRGQLNGR